MRRILPIITLLILFTVTDVNGQNETTDSLRYQLSRTTVDTSRVLLMVELSSSYRNSNYDSALAVGQRALQLALQINYPKGQMLASTFLGRYQTDIGNIPLAMEYQLKALRLAEENNELRALALIYNNFGGIYGPLKDFEKSLFYHQKSLKIYQELADLPGVRSVAGNISENYHALNQLDSATYFLELAISAAGNKMNPYLYLRKAKILASMGDSTALLYFRKGIDESMIAYNYRMLSAVYVHIAKLYQNANQLDSSIHYAKKGLTIAKDHSFKRGIIEGTKILSQLYESTDTKKSLEYFKMTASVKEDFIGISSVQAINSMLDMEDERRKEVERVALEGRNQVRMNALFGGLFTLLIIAIFLYRNNRQKQRSKRKIEIAYERLKNTQSQLIQSEKMASLGELTAGIAHEIQNPLNFVNNFSEVNSELVEELSVEVDKGNLEEVKAIAKDIRENEDKIKHHGQRAEGIVKGMLQHSRSNAGEKESTDINALADEYLRLAYHGMRAKDNSFNAEFKTKFDPNLPKINVVPQDIGRVLLNLINNAFYAVSEASAKESGVSSSAILSNSSGKTEVIVYKPFVTVSTKILPLTPSRGGQQRIEISVSDNGPGIPQDIKDKIFQPFFTTKPTGSGTGLGLSLSYDIVKAHGGEIKVESMAGRGSSFLITFPIAMQS